MPGATHLPVVDIGPLFAPDETPSAASAAATALDAACRDDGFFGVTGHGLDPALLDRLDTAARTFFALPDAAKAEIAMERAGRSWRGWFPVGGEQTSGRPDRKEGIYYGIDHGADHPHAGDVLHGLNLHPATVPALGPAVDAWMAALRPVADAVLRGIALGLGLEARWFERHLTADPTILFRIFHYPPAEPTTSGQLGVGEHTDYGLLTILAQDDLGGLDVKSPDGSWRPVVPQPGVLVCNLGDMLERLTNGHYRSTPHRVRPPAESGRLSFPYFFDPAWDATVPLLPMNAAQRGDARWDNADVTAWEGTYGEYLTAKVVNVFPHLAER